MSITFHKMPTASPPIFLEEMEKGKEKDETFLNSTMEVEITLFSEIWISMLIMCNYVLKARKMANRSEYDDYIRKS